MASIPSQLNFGAFIPSTYTWDVSQLHSVDVTAPEFKELLVRLYQNINNMLMAINLKDAGYYDTTEFLNGQVYFPDPSLNSTTEQAPTYRQVFRKVINFGALPNTGAKNVAHDIEITSNYSFTRIYGCATHPTASSFIPLPFASPVALNLAISLVVDDTNITITTGIDYSGYTACYVVLEYIKQ